jgi:VIT1/CCC1 family predicted Fe2+/Mn2+ transporter
MPLTPFLVAYDNNLTIDRSYTAATICIAAFFLFVLGFGKSFVTSAKWYISTFETILIGALSAAAAFLIGMAFG